MRVAARMPPFGIAASLALLAGVSACLWSPTLVAWPLSALSSIAGMGLWIGGTRLRILGPLLFGLGVAGLHATHALSIQLPADWERRDVVVSGRVADLPQHQPRGTRFLFHVDDDAAQPAPMRGQSLRLTWYDEGAGTFGGRRATRPDASRLPRADRRNATIKAGQRWQLRVRVRAPRGLRNPGGFDSEKHAMSQRIAATGYVRLPESAVLLSPAAGLQAWREATSARIALSVSATSSRYVRALALGDTRGLDDGDWTVLRANGLTHLIAISGFHVGLVAGFFALFARGMWWLWPGLARRWPVPIAAALAGVVGAMVYTAVAGFALPTVRTALMIAVIAGACSWRRPLRTADALALSLIVVLVLDPLAVLGAGFWLSFLGVAWLLWCLPHPMRRPIQALVSAQAVATVGLLPLSAILFGQASVAGPFANLVAVPWWSLVVVPLSLIGMALEALRTGAGAYAWQAAAWCFDLSWPLFEWLGQSGLALWWLPEPRWFALPLALLGAFWILLPRGVPGKSLAVLLWLPLLWPDRRLPVHGEAELTVVDVGQGLSVLVRTRNHALLFDMGPAVPDGFDAGERAVVPALRAVGVDRVDAAIVSHGDNDHAGGLAAVRLAYPGAPTLAPDQSGVPASAPCLAGHSWSWDGVGFRFLHPPRFFPYLGNDASCVLRIETARGSALLTGDISAVVERELVRRDPAGVRADIVVMAHHGSAGSSDPAFIAATGARHALVASGHGNRFGHPKPSVVARWREAGAQVWDTASSGALRVRLGGTELARPEPRRRTQPRLWDSEARPGQRSSGLSYRPD